MPTMAGIAVAGALGLTALRIAPASGALGIVVLLGITGGMINAVQANMFALAAHVYPTDVRATGVGTTIAVGRLGGVVSPYAGAWALEAGGGRAFFATIAAVMTLVSIALMLVGRHIPPDRRDSS